MTTEAGTSRQYNSRVSLLAGSTGMLAYYDGVGDSANPVGHA
ncbi:hypothetical protein [Rhodopila sp.]